MSSWGSKLYSKGKIYFLINNRVKECPPKKIKWVFYNQLKIKNIIKEHKNKVNKDEHNFWLHQINLF